VATPSWFYEVLGQPRERDRAGAVYQEPVIELDRPANIDWAKDYLVQDAPPSIGGKGGEQTTLDVATVLKDMAISESLAFLLMAEFYNVHGRCDPIWSMDQTPAEDSLPVKIHNAYLYKRDVAPGASSTESEFVEDADFDPDTIKPHGHDRGQDFVILNGLKYSVVRTAHPHRKKRPATTVMTKGQKS
jgi:hypothetical protein